MIYFKRTWTADLHITTIPLSRRLRPKPAIKKEPSKLDRETSEEIAIESIGHATFETLPYA